MGLRDVFYEHSLSAPLRFPDRYCAHCSSCAYGEFAAVIISLLNLGFLASILALSSCRFVSRISTYDDSNAWSEDGTSATTFDGYWNASLGDSGNNSVVGAQNSSIGPSNANKARNSSLDEATFHDISNSLSSPGNDTDERYSFGFLRYTDLSSQPCCVPYSPDERREIWFDTIFNMAEMLAFFATISGAVLVLSSLLLCVRSFSEKQLKCAGIAILLCSFLQGLTATVVFSDKCIHRSLCRLDVGSYWSFVASAVWFIAAVGAFRMPYPAPFGAPRIGASKNNSEIALPMGTTAHSSLGAAGLFEAFVSITFSEIKTLTTFEKIINFCNGLKAVLTVTLHFVPLFGEMLTFVLNGIIQVSMSFARVAIPSSPLHVLVEARDVNGITVNFLITDKRGLFWRILGIDAGTQMELAILNDTDCPIMTTSSIWGFCFLPICFPRKVYRTLVTPEGAILAKRKFCADKTTCSKDLRSWTNNVHIKCGNSKVVRFRAPSCFPCHSGANLIEPIEGPECDMAVRKNKGFNCRDLVLTSVATEIDVVPSAVEKVETPEQSVNCKDTLDGTTEEAEKKHFTAVDVIKVADETGQALKNLKEMGYHKIGTAQSTWEVEFTSDICHAEKCAALLYVIEQYLIRL